MKKILKGIKYVFIVILSLILILNVYLIVRAESNPNKVPDINGYKLFVVQSGSMVSEFNVGDLIFVKEVNIDDLKEKDIIAFKDNENLVTTHRITEIIDINNQKCFKTKGDNNNTRDEGVVCENEIEGKYRGKIPKVGNIIIFIQKPLGFTIMMLAILIVCILIYFISDRKLDNLDKEELREFEEYKKAKAQSQKK